MFNRLILTAAMLAACLPALADSWDSNKNIERAMGAALKTYKKTGVSGIVDGMNNCYAGLDTRQANRNVGRDVEYCVAYALSSLVIDGEISKAMNFPPSQYLNNVDVAVKAMFVLEQARIVTLPEQFTPYFDSRMSQIRQGLLPKL